MRTAIVVTNNDSNMVSENKSESSEKKHDLSRRKVLNIVVAASLVVGSPVLWRAFQHWALASIYQGRVDLALRTPVKNVQFLKANPYDIAGEMASAYNVPISVIMDDTPVLVSVKVSEGTVQDVLNQFVQAAPAYQWRTIMGRLIILPRGAKYDRRVTNVNIVNVRRLAAIAKYGDYLKIQVPYLQDFGCYEIVGSGLHPIGSPVVPTEDEKKYTDPVTLTPDATVVEHLIQLLGDDGTLSFFLSSASNMHWYNLGNVAPITLPVSLPAKILHFLFRDAKS